MNIKESIANLFNQIGIFIEPCGYKVIKNRQMAIKNTNFGYYQIFFDLIKSYNFTYSISCKISIRNNIIEEIKSKVDPYFINDKPTIYKTIFSYSGLINRGDLNIDQYGKNNINFENIESVNNWLNEFKHFMNEIGFSFFNQFQSIDDFDEWFNRPIINGTYNFSKSLVWNDSLGSIVAAKLVENPSFEDLYYIWLKYLTKLNHTEYIENLKKMHTLLSNG